MGPVLNHQGPLEQEQTQRVRIRVSALSKVTSALNFSLPLYHTVKLKGLKAPHKGAVR